MINKKNSVSRKRYSQISTKKRQTLVTSVIQLGQSITKVAKRLKIKLSTAKLILKKFRSTGILFNKTLRNAKKEPKIKVTDSLNRQPFPIIPIFSRENSIPSNNEQIINIYPEVNFIQMGMIPIMNTYVQAQWSWPWAGYYLSA